MGATPFSDPLSAIIDKSNRKSDLSCHPTLTRGCLKFARLSRKALIFEHQSAASIKVCEHRSTENQGLEAKIVEL